MGCADGGPSAPDSRLRSALGQYRALIFSGTKQGSAGPPRQEARTPGYRPHPVGQSVTRLGRLAAPQLEGGTPPFLDGSVRSTQSLGTSQTAPTSGAPGSLRVPG